jgi:hypothetical protein
VPSAALERWNGERVQRLDEVEAVHTRLGKGRGRRWFTEQLNRGYLLLLASEFQGFCRDLHTGGTEFVVAQAPVSIQAIVRTNLTRGRLLDRGNANPGNIGADFGRLSIDLWPRVKAQSSLNPGRQAKLEQLNVWRNAIAHDSVPADAAKIAGTNPDFRYARSLRSACHHLARHVDRAVHDGLTALVGAAPW